MPNTLTVTFNPLSTLNKQYVEGMSWDPTEVQCIINDMNNITESRFTGWTLDAQIQYLNNAMQSYIHLYPSLEEVMKNARAKDLLLRVIIDGKYIYRYHENRDELNKKYYVEQFKSNLSLLESCVDLIIVRQLFKDLSTQKRSFIGILPMVYSKVFTEDLHLDIFGLSELFSHEIAYDMVEGVQNIELSSVGSQTVSVDISTEKFNSLDILNSKKNCIANFDIVHLSIPLEPGFQRANQALLGAIFLPKVTVENSVPTIYISWAGTCNNETKLADLERAPGEETYRKNEFEIMRQIVNAVVEFTLKRHTKINLQICGHSLGAALAELTYHSLQRILALNIMDPKIKFQVSRLEAEFKSAYQKILPIPVSDLSSLLLTSTSIISMCISPWNSPGVLSPIITHSNQLSPLLTQQAIPQLGYFALIDGDIVQSSGEGKILSKVSSNLANIIIFRVKSNESRLSTTLGLLGSLPSGRLLGSLFGFPKTGEVALEMLSEDVAFRNAMKAHTSEYFTTGKRPNKNYYMYYTQHLESSKINEDPVTGTPKVERLLTYYSTVLDRLSQLSSYFVRNYDGSLQDEMVKQDLKFQEELINCHDDISLIFTLLHNQLVEEPLGFEFRIIHTLKQKPIICSYVNSESRTILHYALQKSSLNYELLFQLLGFDESDYDKTDKQGNFPLLSFMIAANTIVPNNTYTYQIGILLLNKTSPTKLRQPNQEGQSVEKIYNSWKIFSYGKEFCEQLSIKLNGTNDHYRSLNRAAM